MNRDELEEDLADRRQKRRKETQFNIALGAMHFTVIFGGMVLFWGWALMLMLGIFFHEFGWLAPIGFWPSLGLSAIGLVLYHAWAGHVARDGIDDD